MEVKNEVPPIVFYFSTIFAIFHGTMIMGEGVDKSKEVLQEPPRNLAASKTFHHGNLRVPPYATPPRK